MFADDVIILGKSRREKEEKINVYRVECRMLGLSINEDMSEIMRIGKKLKEEECICGIKLKNKIKYLGISVGCKGDMREYVEEKIKVSKRMVGYVAYVVRGKKSKVKLGKVLWKATSECWSNPKEANQNAATRGQV